MAYKIPLLLTATGIALAGCNSMMSHDRQTGFTDATSAANLATNIARGAGWADYNNDGCVDLLVTQLETTSLFENQCNGSFKDVSVTSGLSSHSDGLGVAWADYNSDGHVDVYIANNAGPNYLFRNNGNGTFSDIAKSAGVDNPYASMSSAWGDYDHDGDLDLFVANRFPIKPDTKTPDSLYRNNGNGTFTDVAGKHGLNGNERKTFSGTWFDYDSNGTLDLYLAVDFVDDILLSNDGKGNFTDVSERAGISGPAHAMGLAVGDLNNDGCHDLISTNNTRGTDAEHGPTTLYVNNCNGTFSDMTSSWGIADRETVDWGVGFIDWDNDGDEDVAIVSGGMLKGGEKETNILYENRNGKLIDITSRAGAQVNGAAFGSAWADYDNDGDLDWFIANSKKPSVLLENHGTNGNNFLKVQLQGSASNRSAVGARVIINSNGKTQVRTIQAGKGFGSSEELMAHFGLGSANQVDSLQVHWPDGQVTRLNNLKLKANQTVSVQKEES